MHTVRKSKIVPKNSIFRKMNKIENLIFRAKISDLWPIYFYYNLNFQAQKLLKFNNFQFLLKQFFYKITIFGAKIKNIKLCMVFKNSQKSLIFA